MTNGYFLTSFSLSFYPVPAGATPPKEPTEIVPLWPYTSEVASAPNTSAVRTVPTDVVNATLELYAYGFTGGSADEEFWYTLTPPFRTIHVEVDNTTFASVLPFPYVNTGGIDLFAWDPITGAFTLDDRPYQVSVTAALGMLEGTHSFKIQVVGRLPPARWIAGGCLLLYTNASAGPATQTHFQAPTSSYLNNSIAGGMNENVSTSYSDQSTIPISSGTSVVSSWTNESFDGRSTGRRQPRRSRRELDDRPHRIHPVRRADELADRLRLAQRVGPLPILPRRDGGAERKRRHRDGRQRHGGGALPPAGVERDPVSIPSGRAPLATPPATVSTTT